MNYLCRYTDGVYFVNYSTKDLSIYIGKSTLLSIGGPKFKVIQVL